MADNKRFRVEFSGKGFPDHYPHALTIPVPASDPDPSGRAREWAEKQLGAWHLDAGSVRTVVTEYIAPPEPEKAEEKPKKRARKKGKKHGSI